jgi:hypothetical protein
MGKYFISSNIVGKFADDDGTKGYSCFLFPFVKAKTKRSQELPFKVYVFGFLTFELQLV